MLSVSTDNLKGDMPATHSIMLRHLGNPFGLANRGMDWIWNFCSRTNSVTRYIHLKRNPPTPSKLRKLKGTIMRTRHSVTRIPEIDRVTAIPSNSPLLLPSNILIHTCHPRIDCVAEQILAGVVDVICPFLYLLRSACCTASQIRQGETYSLLLGLDISDILAS